MKDETIVTTWKRGRVYTIRAAKTRSNELLKDLPDIYFAILM
jgi:hypothetical protein